MRETRRAVIKAAIWRHMGVLCRYGWDVWALARIQERSTR